jgi:iron(III) transport system permease protein
VAVVALLLVAFLALPLAPSACRRWKARRALRLAGQLHRLCADPGAAGFAVEQPVGVGAGHAHHVMPLAFGFAYALQRSRMRFKPLFRGITLMPLLAPSLLSAISLIYWFGNQGVLKAGCRRVGMDQIYGAPGIVVAECFAVFPHALMILVTALSLADGRLYEAADAMGTRPGGVLHHHAAGRQVRPDLGGLVLHLVITDFGIPKVIGGNFNVLATDVFKLVIGQQDFAKGAVVAILLLAPAVLTFGVDSYVSRADRHAHRARRALPPAAQALARRPAHDDLLLLIAALVLAMLGMAVFASFASFWPYNLTPSLRHYTMGLVDAEVGVGFVNSLKMAAGTAVFGTALVFAAPTCWRRPRAHGRPARRWCACWPCCRWPCPAWCWAWATSSSSTRQATRSTGCTTRSRC